MTNTVSMEPISMESINQQIESTKTANGGWTRKALKSLGVPWPPPKGWKKDLVSRQNVLVQDICPESVQ